MKDGCDTSIVTPNKTQSSFVYFKCLIIMSQWIVLMFTWEQLRLGVRLSKIVTVLYTLA